MTENEETFARCCIAMSFICDCAAAGEDVRIAFSSLKNLPPYDSCEFWEKVLMLPDKYRLNLGFRKGPDGRCDVVPPWTWMLIPDDMRDKVYQILACR